MTLRELFDYLSDNPSLVLAYFLILPLTALSGTVACNDVAVTLAMVAVVGTGSLCMKSCMLLGFGTNNPEMNRLYVVKTADHAVDKNIASTVLTLAQIDRTENW